MFTIKALDSAEGYFGYTNKESIGQWIGEGASILDLRGEVTVAEFAAACRREDPRTGEYLLPLRRVDQVRQKTIFIDGEEKQIQKLYKARQAYDLVFSAPKTVSIQGLYDSRMLGCHERALSETVKELESFNGKLVIAAFQHRTSRSGDPLIHTHLVVANMQHGKDGWRAVDAHWIYKYKAQMQEHYDLGVLKEASRLGYRVNQTGLEDISAELCSKFSRRAIEREDAIEKYREKHDLPDDYRPSNRQIAKLVYWNRQDKEVLPPAVMQVRQLSRLEPAEHDTLFALKEAAHERQSLAEKPDHSFPRISRWDCDIHPHEEHKSKRGMSLGDDTDHEAGLREHHWNYGEGPTYKSGSRMRVG